jgi:Pyruvate/2-oxoacid:ferredoxin oxidoreductase delta subunit
MRSSEPDISEKGMKIIEEQRQKLDEGKRVPSTVMSVNIRVPARQHILTDQQVRDILSTSDHIGITNCDCRTAEGNCKSPVDVCILVGMSEEDIAKSEDTEPIALVDALKVLDRTAEQGLVHLTLWDGSHTPYAICSCCPCCCHELLALTRFGYTDQIIVSDFMASHDQEACDGCGTCVTRCHFEAFVDAEDGVEFNGDKCFGCGLCSMTCPSDAIRMVSRV